MKLFVCYIQERILFSTALGEYGEHESKKDSIANLVKDPAVPNTDTIGVFQSGELL
jgi:hypothetical protein